MTEQQHPITPPPELLQQWLNEEDGIIAEYLATKAARWGADQELEACEEWMRSHSRSVSQWADQLRATRRPKPPSLAEQAQRILVENGTTLDGRIELDPDDIITIRAALERLQELEGEQ